MKRSTKRSKSDDEDSDFQGEDPIKKTSIVLSSRIPLSNIQKANRSLGISAVSSSFKMPLFANGERPVGCVRAGTILGSTRRGSSVYIPLYDPEDPDAILLYTPPKDSTTFVPTFSLLPNSNQTVKNVHVMVDPKLARVLRPHQIEGVKFLYECVTGAKKENAYGCIMADGDFN